MTEKNKCEETVVLIFSSVLWLFVKCCSCQGPCMNDVVADRDFSISVAEHIQEESEMCILIHYNLTVPAKKEFFPYEKIWFEENASNIRNTKTVSNFESETEDVFRINGLPPGEYKYGFRLKWGCNQTYTFPKTVKISVTSSTRKPRLWLPESIEGKPTTISCYAPHLCSGSAIIKLKWTKPGEQSTDIEEGTLPYRFYRRRNQGDILPTADDHNTTVTCLAEYRNTVINSSATLNVLFQPRIQNGSECRVEGKLLVCVCISRGNPLAPISWPFEILTDYSVISYSSSVTMTSTLTLRIENYPNSTMRCSSSNRLGWVQHEIQFENRPNSLETTDSLDYKQTNYAAFVWIAAVSFSLNIVLLTILVIYIGKQRKIKQRKDRENNTYASLERAYVEQEYSVISPQCR